MDVRISLSKIHPWACHFRHSACAHSITERISHRKKRSLSAATYLCSYPKLTKHERRRSHTPAKGSPTCSGENEINVLTLSVLSSARPRPYHRAHHCPPQRMAAPLAGQALRPTPEVTRTATRLEEGCGCSTGRVHLDCRDAGVAGGGGGRRTFGWDG